MAKPQKTASLEEAQAVHLKGDEFVYNNPCSKCKKECSTPTLAIWKARIELFGGVKEMYEQYVCRDCRKLEKGDKPAKVKDPVIPPPKVIHVPVKHIEEVPLLDVNVDYIPPYTPKPAAVFVEPVKKDLPTVIIKPFRNDPEPGETVHVPPGKIIVRVWEVGGGEPRRFVGSNAYDV